MTWLEYLAMVFTVFIAFLTISITSYRFHKESEYLKNKYVTKGINKEKARVKEKLDRLQKTQSDREVRVAIQLIEDSLR
jgi:hypothetical protein